MVSDENMAVVIGLSDSIEALDTIIAPLFLRSWSHIVSRVLRFLYFWEALFAVTTVSIA